MFRVTRRSFVLAAPAAALALAGCSAWRVPASIEVPRERLQAAIERRFPLRQRIFGGIELAVTAPRLTLLPEQDRVALVCDVAAGDGPRGRLGGTLAVSHGLAFDALDNSVHMVEVRIERLEITGLDPGLQRSLERPAAAFVQRLLEGQPVYALRPQDIERLQAAGVVPSRITVTPHGLSFALVPRPAPP